MMTPANWIAIIAAILAFAGSAWANWNAYRALRIAGKRQRAEAAEKRADLLLVHMAEFHDLTAKRIYLEAFNRELQGKRKPSVNTSKIVENQRIMISDFERRRFLKSYVDLLLDRSDADQDKLAKIMKDLISQDPSHDLLDTCIVTSRKVLQLERQKISELTN